MNAEHAKFAQIVSTEHENCKKAMASSLDHAKKCGDALSQVHRIMTYVDWVKWCENDCGISEATANNYVRIFKNWEQLPKELNYTEALKVLRKNRHPRKDKEPLPRDLSTFQKCVLAQAKQFFVKGNLDNLEKFLDSFGVKAQTMIFKEAA